MIIYEKRVGSLVIKIAITILLLQIRYIVYRSITFIREVIVIFMIIQMKHSQMK